MGQADDQRDCEHRVDGPGRFFYAEQRLPPHRVEADRTRGDDIAEGQHHRRYKDWREQHRFDPATPRQVGADHQEREHGAERNRDKQHAARDAQRVFQRQPEVGVIENKLEGASAEGSIGIEKWRVQKALEHNER
jgi:hypothetical protein